MLSQLTTYLFGVEEEVQDSRAVVVREEKPREHGHGGEEEDWVLVSSPERGSTPSSCRRSNSIDMNESWLVTADLPMVLLQPGRRRQEGRQPKGTKPRKNRGRNRNRNTMSSISDIDLDEEDIASLDSSIAVIPAPETRAAAAALLQAAALADATQMAAISSARVAHRVEMKKLSRGSLERANKIIDTRVGGKGRHLLAERYCGSINNRKC